MKKFLCVLSLATLLIGTSINTYAEDKVAIPADSLSWSKVYNDAKAGISGLASALKVGAEHVYEVLVKQQIVNSITYLLSIIVGAIISSLLIEKGFDIKNVREYDDTQLPFFIFGAFVAISTLLGFCYTIGDIVTGFVNPEYGAMKEIMNFVK